MLEEAGYVFDEFSMTRLVARFNAAPSQHVPVILDQATKTITSATLWRQLHQGMDVE
jgi:hypothetical protein